MKISPQEVAHVASLAKLRLSEEQSQALTEQLNDILAYMDKLGELDTSGVPPTSHALDLTGAMRPDQVTNRAERDKALANAPESDGESFLVPIVI